MQEWLSESLRAGLISVTGSPEQAIPFGDIIWIAVNTPARLDHLYDLQALESVIEAIVKYRSCDAVIVVKSTVTTGTCRRLLQQMRQKCAGFKITLVFNPEFLREGHAIKDFMEPRRVILGTENREIPILVNKAYQSLGIRDTRIISATFEDAEVVKQASNSFLAVKLTYINELANYCRRVSADIHMVTYCMGLDERIAPGYMKNGLGYGGACLPKDTGALAADASQNGTPLTILEQAISANDMQMKYAADAVRRHIPAGSVLAVWGLSFKPESSDLRCSPAWTVLSILSKYQVYRFQLYDPHFKDGKIGCALLPSCVQLCASANEAAKDVDGLLILTAHEQFRAIDLRLLRSQMRGCYLFDFFDLFSDESTKASGLRRITKID